MEVKWHETVDGFFGIAQAELEKNEALNNLMLGICFRAQADPAYYPVIKLATIAGPGGLILAAVMTPPHNLILYSAKPDPSEPLAALAHSLRANKIHIPGVIGLKSVADKFSRIWAERMACAGELSSSLRAYVLTEVNPGLISPGVFRLAARSDLDFLATGWVQFHIECDLLGDLEGKHVEQQIRTRMEQGSLFVWEDNVKVVSMAAKTRAMRHGAVVGYVYTPRELRGKGYATSCVAKLSQHLLDQGYEYCALFTNLANPISNSIYQKIGYKPVGDYASYRFKY